jgi:leucyl aminopeptidase (aminopeptidase T)
MYEWEMMPAAVRIVRDVIGVNEDTRVLVVTDEGRHGVGMALSMACRAMGAQAVLTLMPLTGEHGREPPATVAAAMRAAEVVFLPTTYALTHTRARLEASAGGSRVVILRGVDEEMMIRGAMSVDFQMLKARTARLVEFLSSADTIQVTSEAGTAVHFKVTGRRAFALDGYFHEDTGFAVLPPGEVPISPVEGTTNGTIVFDYSMDSLGRLRQPLTLGVEEGKVHSVTGSPEEVQAVEKLFADDPSARNIAEFAIGTNPNARLIGNLAEDKKRTGTVHFAIGDNLSLGGRVESSIHLDGLMLKPTVRVDGQAVVEEGLLLQDWFPKDN